LLSRKVYTAKIMKHDFAQKAIVINPFQLQAFSSYATPQIGFFQQNQKGIL